MQIHLRHPKHGVKTAHLQAEADADKKNGWKEFDPSKPESKKLGRPPRKD